MIKDKIEDLPYTYIIVWSGIIEECINLVIGGKLISKIMTFCIDFNNIEKYQNNELKDFQYFYQSKEKIYLILCC